MSTQDSEHIIKVSSDPTEAINEVALDELNRMHRRLVRLESENITLKKQLHDMQQSLAGLWSAYNSHPHHQ